MREKRRNKAIDGSTGFATLTKKMVTWMRTSRKWIADKIKNL